MTVSAQRTGGREPWRILEIGAGDGALARALATMHPQAEIVAVELDQSKRRIYERVGSPPNMTPIWTRVEDFETPDLFDDIYFFFPAGIGDHPGHPEDYLSAVQAIARRIAQLLKPNTGRFMMVTEGKQDSSIRQGKSFIQALEAAGLQVESEEVSTSELMERVPQIVHSSTYRVFSSRAPGEIRLLARRRGYEM
jgi:cyclopropane fatty-acyl-phospholipid synthase-like methyltransferase